MYYVQKVHVLRVCPRLLSLALTGVVCQHQHSSLDKRVSYYESAVNIYWLDGYKQLRSIMQMILLQADDTLTSFDRLGKHSATLGMQYISIIVRSVSYRYEAYPKHPRKVIHSNSCLFRLHNVINRFRNNLHCVACECLGRQFNNTFDKQITLGALRFSNITPSINQENTNNGNILASNRYNLLCVVDVSKEPLSSAFQRQQYINR